MFISSKAFPVSGDFSQRDDLDANGSDLPSPRLRRGRQVRSEKKMPLANLILDTAHAAVEALGLEQRDLLVEGLATRWQRGTW